MTIPTEPTIEQLEAAAAFEEHLRAKVDTALFGSGEGNPTGIPVPAIDREVLIDIADTRDLVRRVRNALHDQLATRTGTARRSPIALFEFNPNDTDHPDEIIEWTMQTAVQSYLENRPDAVIVLASTTVDRAEFNKLRDWKPNRARRRLIARRTKNA